MKRTLRTGLILILLLSTQASFAQDAVLDPPTDDEEAILEVVNSALGAISAEDLVGFTDLMVENASIVSVRVENGRTRFSLRSREVERSGTISGDIVERGFDPEVRVSGPLATVWLPYDLYIDDAWSHCGVDTFILLKTESGWQIVSMAWTVEQPPACAAHPDGPPTN